MAANVLFKSDDRGNSWEVISDDLTANIDRNTWPVMGKYWSADAVAKDVSTSQYGMVVSLVESPVQEGLLYTGTDDGVISVTEDGGQNWKKITSFPDVPAHTYVSDIYASRYDANVVYASFDNRKRDDFKPYLLKSNDKGKNWESITNGFPENGTVHTIEQDHKNKDLLFAGTEFGAFFSYNGGEKWTQLKSGLPTIAVRDMVIQERENDLVLATFGRGFYILDDYTPLRDINPALLEKDAHLFPIKDALVYAQTSKKYGQGSTYFTAPNPDFGAIFTYYLKEVPKTDKQIRREKEKELFEAGKPIPQPTWKELEDEAKEVKPYLIFTIKDQNGNVVRKLNKKPSKGLNRVNWDLQYTSTFPINLRNDEFNPLNNDRGFWLVLPGQYSVSVSMYKKGEITSLIDEKPFTVKPLDNNTLPAPNQESMVEFKRNFAELGRIMQGAIELNEELLNTIAILKQAIVTSPNTPQQLLFEAESIEKELEDILFAFEGSQPKASSEEIPPAPVPLTSRLYYVYRGQSGSTSAITQTSKMAYKIIQEELPVLIEKLEEIKTVKINTLENKLNENNVPYTPGRILKMD